MDRPVANSYFGTLQRRLQTRHVRIGQYAYAGHSRIARHAHEQPFLSLLLRGRYRERVGGSADEISGPAVVVHAAGESHQDEFAAHGAVICSVDVPAGWLAAAALRGRSVHAGPWVHAAARQVTRALRPDGDHDMESALLHLVGLLGPIVGNKRRGGPPAWLARVAECLHDRYACKLPLGDLAALADVHPVHLARHFQRTYACTIGDYQRALRVDHAVDDLLSTDTPLADLAATHGFADQSHLSRLVREQTGRTPGEWRSLRKR